MHISISWPRNQHIIFLTKAHYIDCLFMSLEIWLNFPKFDWRLNIILTNWLTCESEQDRFLTISTCPFLNPKYEFEFPNSILLTTPFVLSGRRHFSWMISNLSFKITPFQFSSPNKMLLSLLNVLDPYTIGSEDNSLCLTCWFFLISHNSTWPLFPEARTKLSFWKKFIL